MKTHFKFLIPGCFAFEVFPIKAAALDMNLRSDFAFEEALQGVGGLADVGYCGPDRSPAVLRYPMETKKLHPMVCSTGKQEELSMISRNGCRVGMGQVRQNFIESVRPEPHAPLQ